MATTFHLVRHASHSIVNSTLAGRLPGVRLSDEGRAEATRLAQHFAEEPVMAVISSPQERAKETAEPIAEVLRLQVKISAALDEIDMGDWQGRSFSELADNPLWTRWNAARSLARPPGGETMLEVQARLVGEALALHHAWPDGAFVLVSHAEPIRALLLYVLGLPVDAWARLDIAPASISTIAIDAWSGRVIRLNATPGIAS